MKISNVLPVVIIMIIAWLGLIATLYVIDIIIYLVPQGTTSMEKLVYSIVKIGLSAIVAFTWLSLWFMLTLKYRNAYLKRG
ncbi:MAG: hypothetical protein DRO23_02365 [Thermoprotei archaeon]|nr:MAG: hypothetical protein DRO23_02365 [Thermoprotei archaeon]